MIIILLKRSDWNNGNCLRNIFLAAAVQTGDAKVTQRGDIVWNVNRDQLRRMHAVICPRQSTVDNTTDSAQFDDAFRAAMRLRMLLLCVCVCVCVLSQRREVHHIRRSGGDPARRAALPGGPRSALCQAFRPQQRRPSVRGRIHAVPKQDRRNVSESLSRSWHRRRRLIVIHGVTMTSFRLRSWPPPSPSCRASVATSWTKP